MVAGLKGTVGPISDVRGQDRAARLARDSYAPICACFVLQNLKVSQEISGQGIPRGYGFHILLAKWIAQMALLGSANPFIGQFFGHLVKIYADGGSNVSGNSQGCS